MAPLSSQMRYSIHDKTLAAKQARIFINAVVDCAKAGIKSSFVIKQMLSGISLYLECGRFTRENWRSYHRISDAARLVRASGDEDWKRKVTFEHARPLSVMYQMLRDERATLTLERAAFIIGEYPPVLVTVEEDLRMAKLGLPPTIAPTKKLSMAEACAGSLTNASLLPWLGFCAQPATTWSMSRKLLLVGAGLASPASKAIPISRNCRR